MDSDMTDVEEEPVSWKTFHSATREYVVFLLLFIFLYVLSYFFICLFRKKFSSYPECYEDAFAHRISLWLCSFSLSISIGAALLHPISIVSNEVLHLYPKSYYVQWLNSSLIQGLWNHVFLFSNVSLFLFLPFSHFIMESEGFPGSRKGIMSRVNEALLVLGLIGLVIMSSIYIISAIFDSGTYIQSVFTKFWNSNIYDISSYYLPFLYSCVSFLGVLMLVLCTPFGFTRLFSVMSDLIMNGKVTEEVDEDEEVLNMLLSDTSLKIENNVLCTMYEGLNLRKVHVSETEPQYSIHEECQKYDMEYEEEKPKFAVSMRKNCLYPSVMFVLVVLSVVSVMMVMQNTLELTFGIKSLPIYSQNFSLGISSLSVLGPTGAGLEIVLILYLWCTSVVGLYSLPLFCHLKPKLSNTSLTVIVGNCAVLLVLSSALPVLARSLGITHFDLLGDFGRVNWLGNFYIVLFHNIVFAVSIAVCLLKSIGLPFDRYPRMYR